VDSLPDSYDGKDDRRDASAKIESISVHVRSKCDVSP
jgi:hypothetical protein